MRNYKILPLIFVVAASLLSVGCSNYGTKLEYKKGELYYTSNVTEAEAKKLGDYLTTGGYFVDTEERSVQLDKSGDTYQVRLVVKEGIDKDESKVAILPAFAKKVSQDVFNGAKVELHLTDKYFKTLRVVPMG